uniref:TSC complex subunit 1a n=1 Tax=Oreochromis niloticus TaxID=8128 RepID=I3IW95_ORENI
MFLLSDKGGAVLSSVVEYYLDSSSSQALLLLSSIREPHHKVLLEKLNESVSRSGTRLGALTLLGHMIRKQLPWVHHISRSPLLLSLLRCLKTDSDVVVLITGVLVLVTLLPMIPQAGKQHINDFFDVFGRLASRSCRNPGHEPVAHLVHLHAGTYSLFHRLYGMFPCSFISYLRLHYSMKENLDTFQEVIKPMLEHVRVHPELITGTQDYELDPSRWRCYEVHDIVIECSRVSLDPLESSCEEDVYLFVFADRKFSLSFGIQMCASAEPDRHLHAGKSPVCLICAADEQALTLPVCVQPDDVTWSPTIHCGLSTPPSERTALGSTHPLSRSTSISGDLTYLCVCINNNGVCVCVCVCFFIFSLSPDVKDESQQPLPRLLTSTPTQASGVPLPPSFTTPHPRFEEPGSALSDYSPSSPYDPLFELALPRAAMLFVGKTTQEVLEKKGGGPQRENREEEVTSVSPLKVLDQLIARGNDAHDCLSRRLSAGSKSVDRSHFGGSTQEEELQSLTNQLLLVHAQLQYERFKRQQHAIRNRRLLRRVINTTALEEQSAAMKSQLGVQDEEIRSLRASLDEEQRRYSELQRETHTRSEQLHTHIAHLLHKELHILCSDWLLQGELSEQLHQQMFLLNQQLVLLGETNKALQQQLEGGETQRCTFLRLKDNDVQQRQKLEAANHRITELESQLARKDQLILSQKKLLEDTKNQNRAELSASESRCAALRRVTQALQTEMLQLYGQIAGGGAHPDGESRTNVCAFILHVCFVDKCLPFRVILSSRSDGGALPDAQGSQKSLPPSSSAVGIMNGAVEVLSTSPVSLSLSPIDSPLAVGSFLEQRARQLFRPTDQNQEAEVGGKEEEEEEVNIQPASPPLGQEVEEATLLVGSPQTEPLSRAADPVVAPVDLTLTVQQRRHELSIMDYDETLPDI